VQHQLLWGKPLIQGQLAIRENKDETTKTAELTKARSNFTETRKHPTHHQHIYLLSKQTKEWCKLS